MPGGLHEGGGGGGGKGDFVVGFVLNDTFIR